MGRRRYATEDTSRNSVLIALLTMGEGWHNNHHYYQASARQGFFWWEWDPTYYGLKALSALHIVRGLRTPSPRVLAANRVAQGSFDIGMFRAYWSKATGAVASSTNSTRDAATQSVQAHKQALEEFVHRSLESAEELAQANRHGQRDLGLEHS
jgi:stearoyl-CoA desaturase (delta-9 desaturase)